MCKKPEHKPAPKPEQKLLTEAAKQSKPSQQNFSSVKASESSTNSTGPKKQE
jgi:hypothetical protein